MANPILRIVGGTDLPLRPVPISATTGRRPRPRRAGASATRVARAEAGAGLHGLSVYLMLHDLRAASDLASAVADAADRGLPIPAFAASLHEHLTNEAARMLSLAGAEGCADIAEEMSRARAATIRRARADARIVAALARSGIGFGEHHADLGVDVARDLRMLRDASRAGVGLAALAEAIAAHATRAR